VQADRHRSQSAEQISTRRMKGVHVHVGGGDLDKFIRFLIDVDCRSAGGSATGLRKNE
jgi:hypothetical protein